MAECPSSAEAAFRTKALESSLIAEGARARRWRYRWGFLNDAVAVGSFAVLPFYEREKRPDAVVGGLASAFSGSLTLAWPLEVEGSARDLESSTSLAPCERLRYDERLLAGYGENEASRTNLLAHAFAIGGAAATGGFIAIAFHHGVSGVITFASGVLLGEGQLLTQPTRLTATNRGRAAKLVVDALSAFSVSTGETGAGYVLRASGAW